MLKYIFLVLVAALLVGAAMVRLRPLSTTTWHVTPESIATKGASGQFSVTTGGDLVPYLVEGQRLPYVATKLRERITTTPRTTRLAGSLEDGFASFVTRSRLWGFPDVTNIALSETEAGTLVEMAGRQVYGKADFGVNEARVRDWLAALRE